MALLEIDWDDPDQDFLTGLTDDIAPFTLPSASWGGGGDVIPYSTLDDAGERLRRFAYHGAYNYTADPSRSRQEGTLEQVNTGEADDPVEGETRELWRLLFAAVRADRFSEGLVATHLVALTRLANEVRRRELEARRSGGATASSIIDPFTEVGDGPEYRVWADESLLDADAHRLTDCVFTLHPGSFLGNPTTASVILLGLNAGYSERDHADEQTTASIAARARGSFHRDTVFSVLADDFGGQSGSQWWHRALHRLVEGATAAGASRDALLRGIAAVEWFPYHSRDFATLRRLRGTLPSQALAFRIVHNAVRRGAVIVALRSYGLWSASVPALTDAPVIRLGNPRRVSVSPGNMAAGEYRRLVAALTT